MKAVYRSLCLLLARAVDDELRRMIQFLKVENDILRSKLPKRVVVNPMESHFVASDPIDRGRAGLGSAATAWVRILDLRGSGSGGPEKNFMRVVNRDG